MVQVPRFYFPSAALRMQNIVTSYNLEEEKKSKSSKSEWKLQPRETYSTSVFVHGCKHLDLVYDLGREAAAM